MSWSNIYKLSLGIFMWTLAISATGFAQSRSHTVQPGETLYSIARQYNVTINNLKDWNNLQSNQLSVGQKLLVERLSPGKTVIHTVEAQETLFSISKRYGVNISGIKSWNNLAGNNLRIGQKLTIHLGESGNEETQSSPGSSIVVSNPAQKNSYYSVKDGDTLYRIALKHDMTVKELQKLNDLHSNSLSIGQRLIVKANSAPPSIAATVTESSPQGKFLNYRAESTQSLNSVLNKFEMTETEFKALNPDFSSHNLQKGQKAVVLVPPTNTYSNPYRTNASLESLGDTKVSRYSAMEEGKATTNGELYNPEQLTAAHSNIAMGTVIYIKNPHNDRGVYVRINDRLSGNGLKLSDKAWKALATSSVNPSVQIFQDQ